MPNTRESAILSAAVEAIEWKNPMETVSDDGKRRAARIVIYPADMPQIEEAINEFSQNPYEREDGSHIAFSKIIEKCAEYEVPQRILREDSSDLQSDAALASVAPTWLNMASQASVGGRGLVLEDGPDVMNSSDEDSSQEEHGEVLTGMFTDGLKAPVLLTQSQVAQQKALNAHFKSVGYGNWINSGSNCPSSSEGAFSDSDPSRSQSVPSSPSNSRAGSRFDTPDIPEPPRRSYPFAPPRASTPTGEAPQKQSTPTAVTPPPLSKESKRRQKFLSDSTDASDTTLRRPAVLLSSKTAPPRPEKVIGFGDLEGQGGDRYKQEGGHPVCRFR
jgi:hypothetical protein